MKENYNLPPNWQLKKLGDILHTTSGGTPSRNKMSFYNGTIPWVKSGELDKGIIIDTEEKITEEAIKSSSAKIFPKGTLLIALYGATIGKLAFLGVDASTNQAICGIFANEKINLKYIYYFLFFKKQDLIKQGIGGAQPNISQTILKNLDIPFFSLNEQDVIVSKIEELFNELDKGIEQLKTARQQLKIYRQSLLKAAFEGKLTNENAKEGKLSKEWKTVTITDLVKKDKHGLKAGPFGSSLKKEFYVSKGYKIYGQEQVISGDAFFGNYYIDEEKYNSLISCKVEAFDILISLVGTVGKVLILPENFEKGIINPRLIKISVDSQIYLPKFFKYYFESSLVKNLYSSKAQGTTMDVLNLGIIKTIPFPLPSLLEQESIVQELESNFIQCDKIDESIENHIQQAEILRQSILKQAFEGKLVTVKEQRQEAKVVLLYKPKNEYFYQLQVLGLIAKASKQNKVPHGEMTLAKYAYLTDKLFDVPTFYNYQRWHLGPFPPIIKKAFNNKLYFKKVSGELEVLNEKKLFKAPNPYQQQIENAVTELTSNFSKYEGIERSHKTELLATVCKVVEDIQTVDLKAVRASMAEWKIELKGEKHKTKAEKFTEAETKKCLAFLKEKRWDIKLFKTQSN